MKARLYAAVFAALSMASVSTAVLADNDSNNVSWKRVIGIIQAGNMVGNITGGGQPWSTLGGEAHVNLRTGHVEFEVRGLVLAGGNTIGIVFVSRARAPTTGVVTPKIALGRRSTSSFAKALILSASSALQRSSIRRLLPSVHPSFESAPRNVVSQDCAVPSLCT